ncbi:unnamed protein product, partial [Meganyctiphanes norvegica]
LVCSKASGPHPRYAGVREPLCYFCQNELLRHAKKLIEIIKRDFQGRCAYKSPIYPVCVFKKFMVKRAQGRKKFGIKNFKRRYFRLTTHNLSYAKTKGSAPLCQIPVDDILAVERVEESSFKCQNMFQLVQPNRTLYIQTSNCVEEKEWLDLLTKVCQYNNHRLKQYHPGAYINSHWLCCRASSEAAPGCSAVSNYLECDLKIHIDTDREVERIHSLVLENMDRLEQLQIACEIAGNNKTNSGEMSFGGVVLEDPVASATALSQVIDAVCNLNQEHKNYERRRLRSTRYGSKQAPIGDDNYLLLASSLAKFDTGSSGSNDGTAATPVRKTSSSPCCF